MTIADKSSNGHQVSRLMIASAILALATGFSSLAYAQGGPPGSSSGIQEFRLSENDHHLDSSIEGSWIFDIDVLSQGTTFHSLISFTEGSVVITSASLPKPAFSPFYGSWRQTGANRFGAAFYAFLPDATGIGVALSKVSLTMQLTGRDTLTGTAVGASCDLDGDNCVQDVTFQFTGKRILPE